MEPHKAIFKVISKTSQRFRARSGTFWKYECLLVNGPHKGRRIWAYGSKDYNEWELGAKYAGKVKVKKYCSGDYNTITIDRSI